MNDFKCNIRLGHLLRVLLFMSISELVQSRSHTTTAGPDIAMQTTSGVEMKNATMENVTRTAEDITLEGSTATTLVTGIETDTSPDTVSTDVNNVQSSLRVSDLMEMTKEVTTFMTTSVEDFQFDTTFLVEAKSSTIFAESSTPSAKSSTFSTAFNQNTDGKSTERLLNTETDKTVLITTSAPFNELTTWTESKSRLTSSTAGTSSSGEYSDVNQETSTVTQGATTFPYQSVAESPRKNTTVTVTMSGDCREILKEKYDFMGVFKHQMVQYFAFLTEEHIIMLDAKCGSVVVELIVFIPMIEIDSFRDTMEKHFGFTYQTFYLQVDMISIQDAPTVDPTTVSDGEPSDSTNQIDFQQTLIFIVIGSVGGAFLLLSFFLLCQYLVQKVVNAGKKSYRPSDEPCIKLADFNMAHTYIPRPQSIYTATTRSSFLPYESMDQGYCFSSASPTPYVYADGDQIREHYQEIVEKEAVTPTSKTINDFGKSGIPSWDLPILEGVVQEGANGSTLKIDGHKQTSSSTFHAQPEDNIPPPPTSSPPPPPPSVEYLPPGQRGAEGSSLKSDDGSSHTEQSLGDTRHLIRTQKHHDVGIDNPAVDIDNAYF